MTSLPEVAIDVHDEAAQQAIGHDSFGLHTIARTKGRILLCLEGELHTQLEDGRTFVLTPGMSYHVADDAEPHRSSTAIGATLFIVD